MTDHLFVLSINAFKSVVGGIDEITTTRLQSHDSFTSYGMPTIIEIVNWHMLIVEINHERGHTVLNSVDTYAIFE